MSEDGQSPKSDDSGMEDSTYTGEDKKEETPPDFETQLQDELSEFEDVRNVDSTAFYLGTPQTNINGPFVHEFHKFIRQRDLYEELDLILDSGGGKLDSSVKLINICNQYSESVNVFVPFYAKSAATVIALSADELYLGRAGELGPVDPLVSHPSDEGVFVQAHSVMDAVEFIEQKVSDELVKEELASQLDIYWIGFGQRAIEQSRQYLDNIEENEENIFAKRLIENYKDHGYPIDRTRCEAMDIPIMDENKDIEEALYDVHETAIELYSEQNLSYIISGTHDINKETQESPGSMLNELLDELPEEAPDDVPDDLLEGIETD